jgi:hypothetical protein
MTTVEANGDSAALFDRHSGVIVGDDVSSIYKVGSMSKFKV